MHRYLRSRLLIWITLGILTLNPCQGHRSKCRKAIPKVFDYIVVGSGAAGATIASRLSENPDITVLLLEAGISDEDQSESAKIETPRLWPDLIPGPVTRNYTTVPQAGLNGREIFTGMGYVLGGSTSHNAMSYFRGFKADYDYWAAKGATGWSYVDVLPFFLKLENRISPSSNSAIHNQCGPLGISSNSDFINTPLYNLFRAAANETGIPFVVCAEPSPFGLCHTHSIIKDGKRQSTSVAYLRPVKGRRNLFVLTESQVVKILITKYGKRAYGVQYSNNAKLYYVKARREIILSAGTFDTPKLLQLSGIGPRSVLRKAKIRTLVDLPVGNNYHDHVAVPYDIFLDIPTVTQEMLTNPSTLSEYISVRKGLYADPSSVLNMFYDILTEIRLKRPEIQVQFTDGIGILGNFQQTTSVRKNGTTGFIILVHPKSRGIVQIKSRDPKDTPLINPQYLQEKNDIETIIAGIRKLKELTWSSSMLKVNVEGYLSGIVPPECERSGVSNDDYLRCLVRNQAFGPFHPVGSCKMGGRNDPLTVVDPELRVKGIKGLRVADASIMPEITSANTMAPSIMIGEKAADMIMTDYINISNS